MQGCYNICKTINVILTKCDTTQKNKMKDKNHITISTDAEKSFDKIPHPFMIKPLSKVGIEGTYLNVIKAIYDKPTVNIILNGPKLQVFFLRSRTKKVSVFTTLIQHSTGSPSHSNQTRKRNKGIQFVKAEINLSLFADYMILYIENP
uniref:Reverse transcriptase domain-containing protein n=1 Tax=Myotis myotis TaxID=51298 RepID=A0A7J8ALW1_MYOMY|nr:hypothetical protein mMyoMyo1_008015 [Myotis myotis]